MTHSMGCPNAAPRDASRAEIELKSTKIRQWLDEHDPELRVQAALRGFQSRQLLMDRRWKIVKPAAVELDHSQRRSSPSRVNAGCIKREAALVFSISRFPGRLSFHLRNTSNKVKSIKPWEDYPDEVQIAKSTLWDGLHAKTLTRAGRQCLVCSAWKGPCGHCLYPIVFVYEVAGNQKSAQVVVRSLPGRANRLPQFRPWRGTAARIRGFVMAPVVAIPDGSVHAINNRITRETIPRMFRTPKKRVEDQAPAQAFSADRKGGSLESRVKRIRREPPARARLGVRGRKRKKKHVW